MSEEQMQVIFEPFRQLVPEDKRTGSGLGLAICKMLSDSLGATIQVSSMVNAGTTFAVIVPL